MSKKGETGERDRGKPQPQKKKDRNAKRKEKSLPDSKDNIPDSAC